MAFTTTQTLDNALLRGLNFRLNNNAPISSLYTLYANGQGQTYWSNAINTNDISTLSSVISTNNVAIYSTFAVQSTQIGILNSTTSLLSTNLAITSNYFNSTINNIASVCTFNSQFNDLYAVVSSGLSSLSTTIGTVNSTTISSLQAYTNSTVAAAAASTTAYVNSQVSSISSYTIESSIFYNYSTAATIYVNTLIISTSRGLTRQISTSDGVLSTTIFNNSNAFSTTAGRLTVATSSLSTRVSSLELASTTNSTVTGRWISSQIGVTTNPQFSTINSQVGTLSTQISTINANAAAALAIASTISTNTSFATSTLNSTIGGIQNQIAVLTYEFSVITTSSILAGIYDTFIALEAYTSTLIGSTIAQMNPFLSTLYQSTVQMNISTSQGFYSQWTSTLYFSSISTVTVQAASTATAFTISTLNSTLLTLTGSTFQSSILGYISTPGTQAISTFNAQGASSIAAFNAIANPSSVQSSILGYISTPAAAAIAALSNITNPYTSQSLILSGSNYTATMDMSNYRNFDVLITTLQGNNCNQYTLTYTPRNLSTLQFFRGTINLNVSTFSYGGYDHPFRFDVYSWGIPTSVFSNTFPGIVNYDYMAQYEYTIMNSVLYTNLLGVYPRIEIYGVSNLTSANVYASTLAAIQTNTYWLNTPLELTFNVYAGLPDTYGGPPWYPQFVADVYQGGSLIYRSDPVEYPTSTVTVYAPAINSLVGSAEARVYVLGKDSNYLSYVYSTVNTAFTSITLSNAQIAGAAYQFLSGNELVAHTRSGLFPLKNAVPTTTVVGSASTFYANSSIYAITNLTNGLLNYKGTTPSTSYTSVLGAPTNGQFRQQNDTFYNNFDFYFSNTDPLIAQLSTIQAIGVSEFNITIRTSVGGSGGKEVSFLAEVDLSGSEFRLHGIQPDVAGNDLFIGAGEPCFLIYDFALPTSFNGSVDTSNFIGPQLSSVRTLNGALDNANLFNYYPLYTNFNDLENSSNMTGVNSPTFISAAASQPVGDGAVDFSPFGTSYAAFPNNIASAYDSFTFVGWVYPVFIAPVTRYSIVTFGSNLNNYFELSDGIGGIEGRLRFSGTNYDMTASNTIQTNQWSHVAFTVDSNSGQGELYLNGSRISLISSLVVGMTFASGNSNYLGSNISGNTRFSGNMMEVGLYDTALSCNTIFNIYDTQRQQVAAAQRLVYSGLGLNPSADTIDSIGLYGIFGPNLPINSTTMSNNTMTVAVVSGAETYTSTCIFNGSDVQIFQF
jgi:hypothetical protein